MDEEKIIDQSQLAESISEKIKMEFSDLFLVKPLAPIKVVKEFSKLPNTAPTKDKEGVEAIDVDKVETETKEVDSDYRKGIIIKIPFCYKQNKEEWKGVTQDLKPGDTVLFRETSGLRFDLLKDSRLLRVYDILAVCK